MKAKDLICNFGRDQVKSIAISKKMATHRVVIEFADGSSRELEAQRTGNDVKGFVAAATEAGLLAVEPNG